MSITHFSNRWLNRLYKSIAILLVVLAVLISALRLILPYAHNHKQDLQNYINTTYDSQVRIGSLAMDWGPSGPTLIATNVSLLQTNMAEIDIDKFSVMIDFWRSLRHWQLVTEDFSLDGVNIFFDKTVLTDSEQDINVINNIAELFLNQINRFSLANSQLIVRTEAGENTIFLNHLNWLNQGNRHFAKGNIGLAGLASNNVIIRADLEGKQLQELSGLAYLEAHKLNITPWLAEVLVVKDQLSHSSVNLNAWLTIDQGLGKKLQLQLGESQITWQNNSPNQTTASVQTLDVINGHVVIDDLASKGQVAVYSSDINIAINESKLAPFFFAFNKNTDKNQTFISSIDLAGLSQLLPLFVVNTPAQQFAKGVMPEGSLRDVFVKYEDNQYAGVADFSLNSSAFYQGIPGVNNLTGDFIYKGPQLRVSLVAKNGVLDFNKHFIKPIHYASLSSTLDMLIKSDRWQLSAEQIHFSSDVIDINADLLLQGAKDKNITMALMANATGGDVTNAQVFYPQLLMGNDLINYLNKALIKGQLAQTQVLINGPLNEFPFKDNQGIFVVDAELVDSTFKFDQHWPAINHFNANLNFTNNQMKITGRGGSLSGIDIKGVEATIADLTVEQRLNIDADINDTSPALITNLMNSSSLADSVGLALDHLTIDNTVSGMFHLSVPLNEPDRTVASGRVDFNRNGLVLRSPHMEFNQLSGSLFFENDQLNSEGLQAFWRGLPLQLQINAEKTALSYVTDIGLNAQWKNSDWQPHLPDQLLPYGSGSLDWQGKLQLTMFDQGNFQYGLNIDSDLANFHSSLPEPYQKQKQQKRHLSIEVVGTDKESVINALLDDNLNFYGKLDHQIIAFRQAHLILGKEHMLLPTEGFHITTHLEQVKLDQWYPFINDIMVSFEQGQSATQQNTNSLFTFPARVRGDIATLDVLGQQLHQVAFNFKDDISWQLLDINAKELRADIKFYPDWSKQGIDIDADFINISLADNETQDNDSPFAAELIQFKDNGTLFNSIPPIQFRCQACSINAIDLGKVSFTVVRNKETELMMENFIAQRRDNIVHFQVNWLQDKDKIFTAINGDFSSKDIEREIEQLGYPSTIKDSSFDSSFSFDWQGSPFDFSWDKLNGNMSAIVGEGVLDVDDKGARLLSLFSLKTIVRKLKLDFRDIFSDGMFFEELKGDFTIEKGVVYTNNTAMKGAAGDLTVNGNTNLVTKQLDYTMSYKPNYSASLPALAWIATLNPVTFLAGVAIDGMITSQVVSEIKFEVTGDILDPYLEKIDGKTQTVSVVGRDSPPQIVDNSMNNAIRVDQSPLPKKNKDNKKNSPGKDNKPFATGNSNSGNSDNHDKLDG